ncbi:MAG: esterase/lipase family protein [Cyanobacteriota bacterium]
MKPSVPLVLVHGLWDDPHLFRRLTACLDGRRGDPCAPHLPHRFGATGLEVLAERLGGIIEARFGSDQPLDLLGFSMGGVIGRLWIQSFGGQGRIRRFLSVGSPHRGTLLAQPCPRMPLAGIADMKIGSALLRRLNADLSALEGVECLSYWCLADAMVIPSWRGVLPVGSAIRLPVWQHKDLIAHPAALGPISRELLRPD